MFQRAILVAAVLCFGAACGPIPAPPMPSMPERRPDTASVTITAEEGANGNSQTAVDVVFASEDAAARLDGMTANEWFVQKDRLAQEFEEGAVVHSYNVDPGTATSAAFAKERRRRYSSVFVFARYRASGDHAYRLEPRDNIVVQLGAEAFTAESSK